MVGAEGQDRGGHEQLQSAVRQVGFARPLLPGRIVLNFGGMAYSGTAVAASACASSSTVRWSHPSGESAVAYLDDPDHLHPPVRSEPSGRRQKLPPVGMFVLVGTSRLWHGDAGVASVSRSAMRSPFDVDRWREPADRHSRRPGSAALSARRSNTSPAQS